MKRTRTKQTKLQVAVQATGRSAYSLVAGNRTGQVADSIVDLAQKARSETLTERSGEPTQDPRVRRRRRRNNERLALRRLYKSRAPAQLGLPRPERPEPLGPARRPEWKGALTGPTGPLPRPIGELDQRIQTDLVHERILNGDKPIPVLPAPSRTPTGTAAERAAYRRLVRAGRVAERVESSRRTVQSLDEARLGIARLGEAFSLLTGQIIEGAALAVLAADARIQAALEAGPAPARKGKKGGKASRERRLAKRAEARKAQDQSQSQTPAQPAAPSREKRDAAKWAAKASQ